MELLQLSRGSSIYIVRDGCPLALVLRNINQINRSISLILLHNIYGLLDNAEKSIINIIAFTTKIHVHICIYIIYL